MSFGRRAYCAGYRASRRRCPEKCIARVASCRNLRHGLRTNKGDGAMKHVLTPADIMPIDEYERVRKVRRGEIIAAKNNRRLPVGPYATFYFENYDTMWLQVH